jgi:hypothetical protein
LNGAGRGHGASIRRVFAPAWELDREAPRSTPMLKLAAVLIALAVSLVMKVFRKA